MAGGNDFSSKILFLTRRETVKFPGIAKDTGCLMGSNERSQSLRAKTYERTLMLSCQDRDDIYGSLYRSRKEVMPRSKL